MRTASATEIEQRYAPVAIIGGGPAGCAAALELRRLDIDVAVFERSTYGAERIGENLSGSARPLLAHLGVLDDFLSASHLPCVGTVSSWGSESLLSRDSFFTPQGAGWLLDRQVFDADLLLAAGRTGAELHTGRRVVRCVRTDDGWSLTFADTTSPNPHVTVRASFVVDASGRRAFLGRHSRAERRFVDRLAGFAATFAHDDRRLRNRPVVLVEAVESGWWYSAPLPDDRLIVVYMTDVDLWRAERGQQEERWWALLQRSTTTLDRVGPMRKIGDVRPAMADTYFLQVPPGGRWLPAGAASIGVDPLSSEGLCFALQSGVGAARAVAALLRGDASEERAFLEARTKVFNAYLQERARLYAVESRWPESVFWRRRHHAA